jgi:hypothetical protein
MVYQTFQALVMFFIKKPSQDEFIFCGYVIIISVKGGDRQPLDAHPDPTFNFDADPGTYYI